MADFKFSAYPKPWEIGVSKFLILLLPPAQVGTIVYSVWLMCGTPVAWISVGIMDICWYHVGSHCSYSVLS